MITLPWWAFAALILWAFVSTLLHIVRSRRPLPWFDQGNPVFSAADQASYEALIKVIRTHGPQPVFTADGLIAKRTIFGNGWILNLPLDDQFAHHTGGPAIVAANPHAAAVRAAADLRNAKLQARVIENPDPDLSHNMMAFVVTNALSGGLLIFRKRIDEMPKPQRYKE